MNYNFKLVLIVIIMAMTSCKVKELAGKRDKMIINAEKIVKINQDNQLKLRTVWIKKIRGRYYSKNGEIQFRANIRIIKDSIIIASIGIDFGIEAIRAYIKKDSVTIINRFNKTWYSGATSQLKDKYGFIYNYFLLEDLLLMGIGDEIMLELKADLSLLRDDPDYCYVHKLKDMETGKIISMESVCFDVFTGYLKEKTIEVPGYNYKFRIVYTKYMEESTSVLASEIEARLRYEGTEHRLLLFYDKWVIEEEFPTKMKISRSYRRVDRLTDL